jgi:diguanylate cyclase (GGDEF)-like protein
MAQTIFILGTDPERCAELKAILQAGLPDTIVTASPEEPIPRVRESDTVILTGDESKREEAYQQLIRRVEGQVRRGELLRELVQFSITGPNLEDMLDRVAAKSTEILGDTAMIVLDEDARLQLEAFFCSDPDRLRKMLMTAVNVSPHTVASTLLRTILDKGDPVLVSNLQQLTLIPELQAFVGKYGLLSLAASPIRGKDRMLGAFVSVSSAPKMLTEQDLGPAVEFAEFTAMLVEHARRVSELEQTATTDSLTGVYNTRFFRENLNRETARVQRYRTSMSLLLIDVDNFKTINDTYLHATGDKVLVYIANALRSSVRASDLVFRCGGDEFAVILPGTHGDDAARVGEKIRQKVEAGDVLKALGHPASATVSVGAAEYESPEPAETLRSHADMAVYVSKRTRNTVTLYRKDKLN